MNKADEILLERDLISIEDLLKTANSANELAIARLAHAMEVSRRNALGMTKAEEAEETALRS